MVTFAHFRRYSNFARAPREPPRRAKPGPLAAARLQVFTAALPGYGGHEWSGEAWNSTEALGNSWENPPETFPVLGIGWRFPADVPADFLELKMPLQVDDYMMSKTSLTPPK